MDRHEVAEVLATPISQQLLGSSIPARLAYTGLDGDPRVIPIAFLFDQGAFVMGTVPGSAKVPALAANPRVAITVDTQDQWPPRALLVRGSARLETVEGVPDAYVEACRKVTPGEHFEEWLGGVHALYRQMVLITVEPDWAKLLDFETTAPEAVERLFRAHGAGS